MYTDIGPVIDSEAKENIEQHIQQMRSKGKEVFQAVFNHNEDLHEQSEGTYVKPTLIELDNVSELKKKSLVLCYMLFVTNENNSLILLSRSMLRVMD